MVIRFFFDRKRSACLGEGFRRPVVHFLRLLRNPVVELMILLPGLGRGLNARFLKVFSGVEAMSRDNFSTKVVVVMPAYNAAKTVEKTFQDIPRHLYASVILVDDGSTDDTVVITKKTWDNRLPTLQKFRVRRQPKDLLLRSIKARSGCGGHAPSRLSIRCDAHGRTYPADC